MKLIYLDHNATAPTLPTILAAMADCHTECGNPSSQHQAGRRARQVLENAREEIAGLVGVDLNGPNPDRLVITSGGTESNNLAILGLAARFGHMDTVSPYEAIISAIEHESVLGPAEVLERRGWRVHRLPVDRNGTVIVNRLAGLINSQTKLVSVMLANNETGVIQPIRELASICNEAVVPLHTDAAQAVGKMPVDFRELGVAVMTFSAHKFHGPVGVGAIAVRGDVEIEPMLGGGFQQAGIRPGTEPVVLTVGMQRALALAQFGSIGGLRDRFEEALFAGYPNLVINGAHAERLPNTSNVAFVGIDRQQLFMALDMAGIACSTGSACASGSSEPSPGLKAMGLPTSVVNSSLRFSFGAFTTPVEIDDAVGRILNVLGRLAH